MQPSHPSLLGFYKETDEPEKLSGQVYGTTDDCFVYVPSHLRNRLELVVGNKLTAKLFAVRKRNGEIIKYMNEDLTCEIKGYWNELHIPQAVVEKYGLGKGDWVEILIE